MITIADAHSWINKFDNVDSYIKDSTKQLLQKAREALSYENYSQVWFLVNRVVNICDCDGSSLEKAEARIECGCIVYRMGNQKRATELFRDARIKYLRHLHNKGATLWMRGYVLWLLPTEHDNAIVDWRQSTETYKRILVDNRYNTEEDRQWYETKIKEMQDAMSEAIEKDGVV